MYCSIQVCFDFLWVLMQWKAAGCYYNHLFAYFCYYIQCIDVVSVMLPLPWWINNKCIPKSIIMAWRKTENVLFLHYQKSTTYNESLFSFATIMKSTNHFLKIVEWRVCLTWWFSNRCSFTMNNFRILVVYMCSFFK